MAKFLSVYSKNLNFTKWYSSKDLTLQDKCKKICPDILTKASIEAILVTFLPTSKIFLSVEINFWKTPSRIISQNLGTFQGKHLWGSSVLAKGLSLRFTAFLLRILKLMILRNFTEAYSESTRTSKMEYLPKTVNGWKQKALFSQKAPT